MNRQHILIGAGALVGAVSFLIFAKPISTSIVSFFFKPKSSISRPSIATIDSSIGSVVKKSLHENHFKKVTGDTPVFHLDQIKVEADANTQVSFPSGWSLLLNPNSLVIIEQYRPGKADSPLLISVVRGTYQLLEKGLPGLLFVTKNQKIFSPERMPPTLERPLVDSTATLKNSRLTKDNSSKKISAIDEAPADLNLPITENAKPLPSAMVNGNLPDKISQEHYETLSNTYIEKVFQAQAGAMRRCQMNSARDEKNIQGLLLLSVTILPNGKTENVKVLQNTLANPSLEQCVTSVVSRTYFKQFEGLPISLTYPLQFQ